MELLPWRAATKQRERRELRQATAKSSPLSGDASSVEQLREVADAQLGLQATYASSLDTQALALLAVDVALIGILTSVLVSPVSLPQHWGFTLIPLAISGLFAVLAATVCGSWQPPARGYNRSIMAQDPNTVSGTTEPANGAPATNGAAPAAPSGDPYADVTQATVPSGLALVPKRLLKTLHLA